MKFFFLFILAFQSSISLAQVRRYNYTKDVRVLRKAMANLDQQETALKADKALESMVDVAVTQLKKVKLSDEANQIQGEFESKFKGYLSKLVDSRLKGLGDIGDHRPLSKWLSDLYERLNARLGPEIMELTHLEDIKTFNFTVPVVFHMQGVTTEEINLDEYGKHWTPFWGIVSYWTVWGVCTGVTYGTGWFVVCTPAGMAAKLVTVRFIAPRFSSNGYELFYGRDLRLPSRAVEDKVGCIGPNVLDLCKL